MKDSATTVFVSSRSSSTFKKSDVKVIGQVHLKIAVPYIIVIFGASWKIRTPVGSTHREVSRSTLKKIKVKGQGQGHLKKTAHLQKNVKQIIFKQILYLKCEE